MDREERGGGEGGLPGPGAAREEAAAGVAVRITAGKSRSVQMVRAGGRKLFKGKIRTEFLEWFAATANVKWSAKRVGIAYQTVWKHRMGDAGFAEDFERALEQGVARVRAKMIETRAKAEPAEIEGDWDAPELEHIDPQVGLSLLREHGFGLGGKLPGGRPAKQGRAPRAATNAEVEAALVKRLAEYSRRVRAAGGGAEAGQEAPPPGSARSPSPGNPGEDR